MYSCSLPVKNVIGVFQVVLQNVSEPLVIITEGVVVVVVVVVVAVVDKMADAGLASDGPIIKVEINGN